MGRFEIDEEYIRKCDSEILATIKEHLRHGQVKKLSKDKPIDMDKINSLKLGKIVGRGGFSRVYDVEGGNFPFVLKIVEAYDEEEHDELSFEKRCEYAQFEAETMIACSSCDNTMHLYDYYEEIMPESRCGIFAFLMPKAQTLAEFMTQLDARFPYDKTELFCGKEVPVTSEYGEEFLTFFSIIQEVKIQIANALQFCKTQGIFHRDIKPENIFVFTKTEDGSEKHTFMLGDFGVSVVGGRGVMDASYIGTKAYAAPEIVQKKQIDNIYACDIYSLGKTLEKCVGLLHIDERAKALCRKMYLAGVSTKDVNDDVKFLTEKLKALMLAGDLAHRIPSRRPQSGAEVIKSCIDDMTSDCCEIRNYWYEDDNNRQMFFLHENTYQQLLSIFYNYYMRFKPRSKRAFCINENKNKTELLFDDYIINQCSDILLEYSDYILAQCSQQVLKYGIQGLKTAHRYAVIGRKVGIPQCRGVEVLLSVVSKLPENDTDRKLFGNRYFADAYDKVLQSAKEFLASERFGSSMNNKALDILFQYETQEINREDAVLFTENLAKKGCDFASFLLWYLRSENTFYETQERADRNSAARENFTVPVEMFMLGCPRECFFVMDGEDRFISKQLPITKWQINTLQDAVGFAFIIDLLSR